MSGIYDVPTPDQVSASLQRRAQEALAALSDDAVYAALADTVYMERKRFALAGKKDPPDPAEVSAIEDAARATRKGRLDMEAATLHLVDQYAREVHRRFSAKTYGFATKVLPGALSRLLTATDARDLFAGEFDPASRIVVRGDVERIKKLAETHTLMLNPTHVSNLDSPMVGYALHTAGLPPFIYGAGLNLFSNPAMAFFMSRLGAYTVDRRKKHALYKDVLKNYSIDAFTRRCHSIFYPGGTRSRSGEVEKKLKKGLMGTALTAWQENLAEGRNNPDILVVPCTISFTLVLEAGTLIEDSLAEQGKSRYIITDDEFSRPRTVASFAGKVLNLDSSVFVTFAPPLDLFGNPVDDEGRSLDGRGDPMDRRLYVCDRKGQVVIDEQRDRVYTSVLSEKLVESFHRHSVALSTWVASFAAWNRLIRHYPRLNKYQLALLSEDERRVDRKEVLGAIERTLTGIHALAVAGRIDTELPGSADAAGDQAVAVLEQALDRFGRYHSRRALDPRGSDLVIDPKLTLYYSNRLVGYGLEEGM